MKNYSEEKIEKNIVIRTFSESANLEYDWHRDLEDRTIEVVNSGLGWKFQKDNDLPKLLVPGVKFFIEKMTFHRLIMGTGKLIIKITKHKKL